MDNSSKPEVGVYHTVTNEMLSKGIAHDHDLLSRNLAQLALIIIWSYKPFVLQNVVNSDSP